MNGAEELSDTSTAQHRVVKMEGGEILNRYWDENDTPRPESFREDIELSHAVLTGSSTAYFVICEPVQNQVGISAAVGSKRKIILIRSIPRISFPLTLIVFYSILN